MPFAKVPPLTLGAFIGLFHGCMERRVAQGNVKSIVGFDHASKDILRCILLSESNFQLVEFTNLLCRFDSGWIYIDASEMPAVFTLASQGVNQAGTGAYV